MTTAKRKKRASPAKKRTPRSSARVAAKISARVTPFLWFDGDAEDAANLYVSLFARSKILSVSAGPDGRAFSVQMEIAGQRIHALNGGPHYKLTPAFSWFVEVKTQAEIDFLWDRLTANGGKESRCGWLTDRYGVSWQILPSSLQQFLWGKDRERSGRAMNAMMKMRKLVIQDLRDAYDGKA